jgi:hypothetical protein
MSESFSDLTIHYSIITNAAVHPCVHAVLIAEDTSTKKDLIEILPRTAGTNRAYKLELSPCQTFFGNRRARVSFDSDDDDYSEYTL